MCGGVLAHNRSLEKEEGVRGKMRKKEKGGRGQKMWSKERVAIGQKERKCKRRGR